jgi:hypothetical protein
MKRHHWWMWGGCLCVVAASGSPVAAQYKSSLEGLVNRPTANAPSQLLGGNYTRSQARPLESIRGVNAPMFGQRALPSRASMRSYEYGRSMGLPDFGPSDLGNPAGGSYFDFLSRAMRDRSGDISAISGLSRVLSLYLPLPGEPIGGVPALSACAYTPRPKTNRFQELLGLQPAAPEGPRQMEASVAERLDARTAELAARAAADGAVLFKEGTRESQNLDYPKYPDCPAKLANALQVLQMASDLDSHAALPSLLITHAALEQSRPLLATSALLKAVRRDPEVLSHAGRDLDRYFGDVEREGDRSAVLTAQMRQYARMADYNAASPAVFALQAYCAWRLGDTASVRASLSQLEELLPQVEENEAADMDGLVRALRRNLP